MRRNLTVAVLVVAMMLPAVPLAHAAAPPQSSVTGVVSGPAGAIAGASVKVEIVKDGVPRTVGTVETGADGSWSYAGKAGSYRFTFAAGGFVSSTETLVMANKGAYTLDVALQPEAPPTGTIAGRITNASGVGIHGYVYFYTQNPDGSWPTTYAYSVETAWDGTYTSPALPLGAYKVRLFTVHMGVQWYRYAQTEELATPVVLDQPGEVVTGVDAQYPPPQ